MLFSIQVSSVRIRARFVYPWTLESDLLQPPGDTPLERRAALVYPRAHVPYLAPPRHRASRRPPQHWVFAYSSDNATSAVNLCDGELDSSKGLLFL